MGIPGGIHKKVGILVWGRMIESTLTVANVTMLCHCRHRRPATGKSEWVAWRQCLLNTLKFHRHLDFESIIIQINNLHLTTADTGWFTWWQQLTWITREKGQFFRYGIQYVFKMSSGSRGDISSFLSTVNVKKLDRSTSGTIYLKHIVSQWTQVQSKLHAFHNKESFRSGLAGCGDYTHQCPCSCWQSFMAITFVWISKWMIYLNKKSILNMCNHPGEICPCVPDDIPDPTVPIPISYIGLFQAKSSKNGSPSHRQVACWAPTTYDGFPK